MTRYFLILFAGVVACDLSDPIGPDSEKLPLAEPGVLLPFAAPQDDGLFPQIAWDSNNSIVLPARPNTAPTTLVRFGLETGSTTSLATFNGGLQVIAGGGGSVFYTQSMAEADVLSRVGGAEVASVTAVQFAVSRNGKWLVIRDNGWAMIELATGARRAVPAIPDGRFPVAIDSNGSQIAFGLVGPFSEYDLNVTLADMTTGGTRTIATPGQRLLAVEFIGERLMLLALALQDVAGQTDLSFVTRSDLPNSARVLGTVRVQSRRGFVGACGAWSPEAGYGVGVIQNRYPNRPRARHEIFRLDTAAHSIGTADLWAPSDCSLSPDGKWFVYGNATGYVTAGELYLKPVR